MRVVVICLILVLTASAAFICLWPDPDGPPPIPNWVYQPKNVAEVVEQLESGKCSYFSHYVPRFAAFFESFLLDTQSCQVYTSITLDRFVPLDEPAQAAIIQHIKKMVSRGSSDKVKVSVELLRNINSRSRILDLIEIAAGTNMPKADGNFYPLRTRAIQRLGELKVESAIPLLLSIANQSPVPSVQELDSEKVLEESLARGLASLSNLYTYHRDVAILQYTLSCMRPLDQYWQTVQANAAVALSRISYDSVLQAQIRPILHRANLQRDVQNCDPTLIPISN